MPSRPDHRELRRKLNLLPSDPGPSPSSPANGADGANGGTAGDAGAQSTPTPDPTPTTSTTTPTPTPTTTKGKGNGGGNTQNQNQNTQTSNTSPTTTSTTPPPAPTKSSTTLPSSSSTTPSSSSSVISHSSTTALAKVTTPVTHAQQLNTNTIANGDIENTAIFTTAPDSTPTSSDTAVAATGSLNVGAVIGGVAGGIAAVAFLFFVCMYFIRRRRDRAGEEFDPVSFRKSAAMVDEKSDPFNPRPPTMIERKLNTHNVAPSISSMQGPNMAGAGSYSNHGHGDDAYGQDAYGQDAYGQDAYGQDAYGQAAQAYHQQIQPRQQYTYGQSYEHQGYAPNGSDHGHDAEYNGAYSSEPQMQHANDIYAAEAYAYPGEEQVVVTPGMHAQDMGHYQQQSDAYGGM